MCWPSTIVQKVTHKANQRMSSTSKNKKPLKKAYGKRQRKRVVNVLGFFLSPFCFLKSITGDIILYDSHLVVYKHSLDLILYFVAGPTENEVMVHAALTSLSDALTMLLRNSLEKRGVLENLDLVLLCLDETIDDGSVISKFLMTSPVTNMHMQNHC